MKYSAYNRLKNRSVYMRGALPHAVKSMDQLNNSFHAVNRAEFFIWSASKLARGDRAVCERAELKADLARARFYLALARELRARALRKAPQRATVINRGIAPKEWYLQTRVERRTRAY